MRDISLPPLFTATPVASDPFGAARDKATLGCDAGLVTYHLSNDRMQAAIVFAPEVPLRDAMAILPICGVGFQNALGALAPPEVGVHLDWDGAIRLNGGTCGHLQAACSHNDPTQEPDWLIIGLDLRIWPDNAETGLTPDQTALFSEGCAEVDVNDLLEAWVRHTLVWVNRWSDEGAAPLHKEWSGIAHGIGQAVEKADLSGEFLGIDEHFGMLLRDGANTHMIPLTHLLEA
ncbi:biotin/lipoate--protein ligase family protein [Loktanella sp. Alg231-35]|uniref:biotin/lipoate--protein ligase family protein n=1 Tax=Loktanella sp. Alg231-35 TaxID=1922220 RepID=UPI000D557E96|nr:biotin/lipoate--protein ligase family protein [Loktanella sp. Alg231-35]